MKKAIIATAISAATAMTATTALAGDMYIFGEGSYSDMGNSNAQESSQSFIDSGQSYVDNQNNAGGNLTQTNSFDADEEDTGFGFGLGYQINEYFGAELAYRNLGEASYTGSENISGTDSNSNPLDSDGHRTNAYESEAVILRGVASYPVTTKLSLEGTLGVAYVETEYSGTNYIEGGTGLNSVDQSYSDDGNGYTAAYGVGASYDFTKTLTGYARWERLHDIDTEDNWDGIEADSYTAGIRYHF